MMKHAIYWFNFSNRKNLFVRKVKDEKFMCITSRLHYFLENTTDQLEFWYHRYLFLHVRVMVIN